MPEVLEKEETKVSNFSNDGRHDKFQHYFSKKDIEANFFEGKTMKALCGVERKAGEQVDGAGLPVCPDCKTRWEQLRDE